MAPGEAAPPEGESFETAKPSSLSLRPGRSSFRLLHISDTHYHPHDNTKFGAKCRDVSRSLRAGCDHTNTTRFLRAAIEIEDPDLIVFTGDVIDFDSAPAETAMRELYGVATNSASCGANGGANGGVNGGVNGASCDRPFAATLGNHDDNLVPRDQLMHFVSALNGSLARHGAVIGSPGKVSYTHCPHTCHTPLYLHMSRFFFTI